jgi:putative DNA primase/helicase
MNVLDIRTLARRLGGDVIGRGRANVPGPNHSKRDRSLHVWIGRDGRLKVKSWSGDDWRECRDFVRSKLGIADDWKPEKRAEDSTGDDRERRKRRALEIWAEATDPRGTLAEKYLREHRRLDLLRDEASAVIRFYPRLYYRADGEARGSYLPAMITLFRDIRTNEPTGVTRTYLDPYTGKKLDRKMLGVSWSSAIKFGAGKSTSLVVGEGVETVLSARCPMGAKFPEGICARSKNPAADLWAVGSAGAVQHFPVLRHVRELVLLLENDSASRAAVTACMRRYRDAGRTVRVIQPHFGSDLNDTLRAIGNG